MLIMLGVKFFFFNSGTLRQFCGLEMLVACRRAVVSARRHSEFPLVCFGKTPRDGLNWPNA